MFNHSKAAGTYGFRFVKRLFDIVLSSVLLLPIGVVVGIAGIFVKLEDGGPVFYSAERTGRYGKPFIMYKLRSMKVDSLDLRLSDGSTYNGEDDPRVTKVGRFLRKTSIDELPQIFNVLKGDMSFIGPRPDTLIGSSAYSKEEKKILNVRPGITGYNQAVNRNSVLTKEKLQNDIYYVEHLSLKFDLIIFLKTISVVLMHKNINRNEMNSIDE